MEALGLADIEDSFLEELIDLMKTKVFQQRSALPNISHKPSTGGTNRADRSGARGNIEGSTAEGNLRESRLACLYECQNTASRCLFRFCKLDELLPTFVVWLQ